MDDVKYETEEKGLDIRLSTILKPVIVLGWRKADYTSFFNLLTNAIRYTPPGGQITVQIEDNVIDQILPRR